MVKKLEHDITWTLGKTGKAMLLDDGRVIAWNAERHGPGEDHHYDKLTELGHPPHKALFIVEENGKVRSDCWRCTDEHLAYAQRLICPEYEEAPEWDFAEPQQESVYAKVTPPPPLHQIVFDFKIIADPPAIVTTFTV